MAAPIRTDFKKLPFNLFDEYNIIISGIFVNAGLV